MKLTYIIIGYK